MFRRRDGSFDEDGLDQGAESSSTESTNFGGLDLGGQPSARDKRDSELNEEAVNTLSEQKSSSIFKTTGESSAKSGISNVTPSKPAYKLNSSGAFTSSASSSNSAASASSSAPKSNTGSPSSKFEGVEAERRLTVGYGITLQGKVSDCDKLIIYGTVDAELDNVKTLHISESGKFTGSANIEQAEISGTFEGDINVIENIIINSTGRVNGKITYGSIEIRPGGKFTGQIVEAAAVKEEKPAKKSTKKAQAQNEEFTLAPEPLAELENEDAVA